MKNTLWRQPNLVELTYGANFNLVKDSIRGKNLKILDVGCGTGLMSLELARRGHSVVGIDTNRKLIDMARRTMKADAHSRTRENLRYVSADFEKWADGSGSFDIVLFSRVLHDLLRPERVLRKAHNLLKNDGRLVCLEYAYDRIDRRTAIWLYQIRRMLEVIGWYSSHLPENPKQGVDSIMEETLHGRKEHINTFEEMWRPLKQLFTREKISWHRYYCWDVIRDLRIPDPRRERKVADLVARMEQQLIDSKQIRPSLFRFVGRKATR